MQFYVSDGTVCIIFFCLTFYFSNAVTPLNQMRKRCNIISLKIHNLL